MKTLATILCAVLFLVLNSVECQQPLKLIFNRQGDDLNNITLTCTDRFLFLPLLDSVFLMDGRPFNESIEGFQVVQSGVIRFILSPEIESVLTCETIGTDVVHISNELRMAALRLQQEFEDKEVTVTIGEQVEIPCEYQPGNLRELYQIEWTQILANGGFRTLRPEILDVQQPEIHLSINPDTYSLTVMALSTSQSGDRYQCTVRIRSVLEVTNRFSYTGALNRLNVQEPEPTQSIFTTDVATRSVTGAITPSVATRSVTGAITPSVATRSVTGAITPSVATRSVTGAITPSVTPTSTGTDFFTTLAFILVVAFSAVIVLTAFVGILVVWICVWYRRAKELRNLIASELKDIEPQPNVAYGDTAFPLGQNAAYGVTGKNSEKDNIRLEPNDPYEPNPVGKHSEEDNIRLGPNDAYELNAVGKHSEEDNIRLEPNDAYEPNSEIEPYEQVKQNTAYGTAREYNETDHTSYASFNQREDTEVDDAVLNSDDVYEVLEQEEDYAYVL